MLSSISVNGKRTRLRPQGFSIIVGIHTCHSIHIGRHDYIASCTGNESIGTIGTIRIYLVLFVSPPFFPPSTFSFAFRFYRLSSEGDPTLEDEDRSHTEETSTEAIAASWRLPRLAQRLETVGERWATLDPHSCSASLPALVAPRTTSPTSPSTSRSPT